MLDDPRETAGAERRSCFVCRREDGRFISCNCVEGRMDKVSKQLKEARARASVLRDKLGGILDRKSGSGEALWEVGVAKRRVERLRARVWDEEQLMAGERQSIAAMGRANVETAASLDQAEALLQYKEQDIVKTVLEPEKDRLTAEAAIAWERLAVSRRIKVKQTLEIFQVAADDDDGQLQGMLLPRHIDSLKSGGTLQQNVALTSLARLVSIMSSLLDVPLPFPLEFRPTQCLIQGKPLTMSQRASSWEDDGGLWLEKLILSFHMLTLNARHLVRTQITAGERGIYLMLCATNDISPQGVLRVVMTLAKLREVGRGEPAATDYAHLEHSAFASERQGRGAATSPTKKTIAVNGDLDGGGGAEWDFVLPPPPSETPDF